MHRTDPAYVIITVVFAVVVLVIVLRRLRSSLATERLQTGFPTDRYAQQPATHDDDDDSGQL
ncbi:hypothetical protein JZ785_01035 [Alicyclobacillus curvatus]|jgi:hypothetical protein|nr:hypothetical protein JZ785_01035 [Alicyclobacillus curvatus]